MKVRLFVASAVCLTMAGCAGTHHVDRTPEARAADTAGSDIYVAPEFSGNMRGRLAAHVGFQYVAFGKNGGAPEVASPKSGVGLLGSGTRVCIRFPKRHSPATQGPDVQYQYLEVSILKGVGTAGDVQFKQANLAPWEKCGDGGFAPFPELAQVGQAVRDCAKRGESDCVVHTEPGRRETIHVTPNMRSM